MTGFYNIFEGCIGRIVLNILINRPVKKDGLLWNNAKLPSKFSHIVRLDVLTINEYLSWNRIIYSEYDICYCGFSWTRLSNKGNFLTCFYLYWKVFKNSLLSICILKLDIIQLNISLDFLLFVMDSIHNDIICIDAARL